MALQKIEVDIPTEELPAEITAMIAESDRRIDALFHSGGNLLVPRYMPSDPELFFRVLKTLTDRNLPLGRVFCEWGCGFGIVGCIAAALGYEAYGIELDPAMAERARSLTADLGSSFEVLETSYLPDGYDSYSGMGEEVLIKEDLWPPGQEGVAASLTYEGMDCDIADIDVFFVYPWPSEQDFMRELFDELAGEGALLITFHKSGEILVFRKVDDHDHDAHDRDARDHDEP